MSGMRQAKIFDLRLIELVRMERAFYDINNKNYTDAIYKENAWRRVGEQLGLSDVHCKKRWCNIRDNYRKALIKNNIKIENGAKTIKRYRYCHQLEFLRHTFEESGRKKIEPLFFESEGEEGDYLEMSDCCEESVNDSESSAKQTKRPNEPEVEIITSQTPPMPPPTQPDPVDAFLAGIAPTLKSLSPYYLNLAKSKIFNIVQEHEMIMIMAGGKNPIASGSSDPSLYIEKTEEPW